MTVLEETTDTGTAADAAPAPAIDLSKFLAVSKGRPSPLAVVQGDGGFWRKGSSGPPMVSAPDGRIAKTGKFAGSTAHVQYGSVENFANLIIDMHDADALACRDVVLALGANPKLMAEAVEFAKRDDINETSGKRDGNAITGRCHAFALEHRKMRRSDAVYEAERLETLENRDFLLRTIIGVLEGHPVEAESELVSRYGLDTPTHAPVVTYSRASKTAELISDKHAVHRWDWRKIMEGIGRDADLAAECVELGTSPHLGELFWCEQVEELCAKARVAARANQASSQGTHTHALTEEYDLDRDWVALAEEGVDLGVGTDTAQEMVAAWYEMCDRYGLENVVVEATVVNDHYSVAGSADRYVRLTRDLTFPMHDGRLITIPAGTFVVGDLKTGRMKLDRRGYPAYWQSYVVQMATYGSALPYDPETGERGDWQYPVDQRWGLLFHLDVLEAMEGNAVCTPYLIDLEKGRAAADLVLAARAFAEATDAISLAPTAGEGEVTALSVVQGPSLLDSEPSTVHDREEVRTRLNTLQSRGVEYAQQIRVEWPAGVPTSFAEHTHTVSELRQVKSMLERLERQAAQTGSVAAPPAKRASGFGNVQRSTSPAPPVEEPVVDEDAPPDVSMREAQETAARQRLEQRERSGAGQSESVEAPVQRVAASENVPADSEGAPIVDEGTIALIREQFLGFDEVGKAWFSKLLVDAAAAGVAFHFKDPDSTVTRVTARRYEISRGLVHLVMAGFADQDAEFAGLRGLLAVATDDFDSSFDETIPAGVLLGRLDADQAVRFAAECVEVSSG